MRNALLGLPILAIALLSVPSTHAQTGGGYDLSWNTIGGGGGVSTGGVFYLSGTIGQPDAGGPMTGANFSLTGGFWSLVAVPTPGAPTLRIFLTGTNAVLAWSTNTLGYTLQASPSPVTANWSAVTNTLHVVGSENQVILSLPAGNRFFRLTHP